MLAQHYAHALYALTRDSSAQNNAENIIGLLKRKGHYALLPSILVEYEKCIKRSERKPIIRVNSKNDFEKLRLEISSCSERLSFVVEEAELVEDTSIVGGFVIENEGKEINKSYRKNLIELYKKLMQASV